MEIITNNLNFYITCLMLGLTLTLSVGAVSWAIFLSLDFFKKIGGL